MNEKTEAELEAELEAERQYIRDMLEQLDAPRLWLFARFLDWLSFKQWVKKIPLRWALWQAGKRDK